MTNVAVINFYDDGIHTHTIVCVSWYEDYFCIWCAKKQGVKLAGEIEER